VREIDGEAPQELPAGSSFYQSAEKIIARFDNASSRKPMKFIAHYLRNGKQELFAMLSEKQG
jgi:hypothetical protein